MGLDDLFNQVPGKPTPLSEAGQKFVTDVKALGATPLVSVVKPGLLGFFGREESFAVSAQDRAYDDEEFGRLAELYGDRITGLYLANTAVTDEGLRTGAGI